MGGEQLDFERQEGDSGAGHHHHGAVAEFRPGAGGGQSDRLDVEGQGPERSGQRRGADDAPVGRVPFAVTGREADHRPGGAGQPQQGTGQRPLGDLGQPLLAAAHLHHGLALAVDVGRPGLAGLQVGIDDLEGDRQAGRPVLLHQRGEVGGVVADRGGEAGEVDRLALLRHPGDHVPGQAGGALAVLRCEVHRTLEVPGQRHGAAAEHQHPADRRPPPDQRAELAAGAVPLQGGHGQAEADQRGDDEVGDIVPVHDPPGEAGGMLRRAERRQPVADPPRGVVEDPEEQQEPEA